MEIQPARGDLRGLLLAAIVRVLISFMENELNLVLIHSFIQFTHEYLLIAHFPLSIPYS